MCWSVAREHTGLFPYEREGHEKWENKLALILPDLLVVHIKFQHFYYTAKSQKKQAKSSIFGLDKHIKLRKEMAV